MPNWVESYRIMKKSEMRSKPLTYRTLANDFCEAARLPTKAINPTKVAWSDLCWSRRSVCWDGRIQTRRRRNASQQQQANNPQGKTPLVPYLKRYYLFTKKVPRLKKGQVRRAVNQALKDDLAEEVERLEKQKEKTSQQD